MSRPLTDSTTPIAKSRISITLHRILLEQYILCSVVYMYFDYSVIVRTYPYLLIYKRHWMLGK